MHAHVAVKLPVREQRRGLHAAPGDHLLFFGRDADAAPRIHNIEPLLTRRAEWAGVDVYVPSQDVLWVGIDSGRSRDFVKLDLADADKRAKPFAQQKVAHE